MKITLNRTLWIAAAALFLAGPMAQAAGEQAPKQANCELRLVSNAGAGEIFLSIFTHSEEECLSKSDNSVEAKFHSNKGILKRGGSGPQP